MPSNLSSPSDAEGNRIAVWSRYNGANTIIQASAYDGAGPRLSISIPTVGTVRRPVSFSVSALDAWSAIGSIGWTFGDGAVASGAQVTHAFARPGTYTVTVVGADVLGFTGAAHATIVIYPKASAARRALVRHGRALLRLHCPSTASCDGAVKLIAGMKFRRRKRIVGKRVQIGRSRFAIPPKKTTTVRVPLTSRGLRLVRKAGTKGLRTQLTGPGVKHRIVVLLARRRARHLGRRLRFENREACPLRCPARCSDEPVPASRQRLAGEIPREMEAIAARLPLRPSEPLSGRMRGHFLPCD